MSSELDALGLLFSALFDAQQQGAKQNGGALPFELLNDFANGVGGTAEAAFNALYPGALANDFVDKVNKKLMAGIVIGSAENLDVGKRFANRTVVKAVSPEELRNAAIALMRASAAKGKPITFEKALEAVKAKYSVKIRGAGAPMLAVTLPDVVSAVFNPKGFVDKVTAKTIGDSTSRFWKVLMAGSSLAGAGLSILAAQRNPHIQTKGDAVYIAGVDPEKRKHAWIIDTIKDVATLGVAKAHEKRAFEHAADLIARATHYTRDGQHMSASTADKVEIAKAAASAIVDYAIQNNLRPKDVLQNWDVHSTNIFNYMRDNPPNDKVARLMAGITHNNWDTTVKRTWVTPGLVAGPIPVAPPGRHFRQQSAFEPKDYLNHLWVYKKNVHKWRGVKFSGEHLAETNIKNIIDGSVEFMARSAEAHGDQQRADAYRKQLEAARIRAHSLNTGEKLYWWKLKWDSYKDALGPQAGFGLLTGNFFVAASGAPLYHPVVNLGRGAYVFQIADDNAKRILTNWFPGYRGQIDEMFRFRGKDRTTGQENVLFLTQHKQLAALTQVILGKNRAKEYAKNFRIYGFIPTISMHANKMQKAAYVVGTFHPYQLLTAFWDGSLGDRLMYIGMNFGKATSPAQLTSMQLMFLRWGLALNSSKAYRTFRYAVLYTKFFVNMPTMLVVGAVARVQDLYWKGIKKVWAKLGVKKAVRDLGAKMIRFVGRSRLGRTAVGRLLKQLLAKLFDFLTGGLAEVALGVYNFLNFITGGALDQAVFKGVLYSILLIIGWVILTIGGVGLLAGSAADVLANPIQSLPSDDYQYSGRVGYGPQDVNPVVLQQLLESEASELGFPKGLLGQSTVSDVGFYSGMNLGVSSCVHPGAITQMWCSGASSYHQKTKAIDLAAGGNVTVYAIVAGHATCIKPGSPNARGVICTGGNYAGNAILLSGTTEDGHKINAWYLHVQCAFDSEDVEAGEGMGVTVTRAMLGLGPDQGNDCWTGPHLHIHWAVDGQYDGKDLFCAIKKGCGKVRYSDVWGKCSVSCN